MERWQELKGASELGPPASWSLAQANKPQTGTRSGFGAVSPGLTRELPPSTRGRGPWRLRGGPAATAGSLDLSFTSSTLDT